MVLRGDTTKVVPIIYNSSKTFVVATFELVIDVEMYDFILTILVAWYLVP